jgi:hypothetical protein
MNNLSFLHAGTFGDTIYSLALVKFLGGGDFYIELDGIVKQTIRMWGHASGGHHTGRYTKEDIDFISPLIEAQPYIKSLKTWNNEIVTHDCRDIQRLWVTRNGEQWPGNMTEVYGIKFNIDVEKYYREFLIDPWLDVDSPIRIPGKPIIINRTPRFIIWPDTDQSMMNEQWKSWVDSSYLTDMAVFIGNEEEHASFCELFKCNVQYRKVSDMLELAKLIKGCEQFIGNQSMALSLAIGLGKTYFCEVRRDFEKIKTSRGYGDVWFPRSNGHYF